MLNGNEVRLRASLISIVASFSSCMIWLLTSIRLRAAVSVFWTKFAGSNTVSCASARAALPSKAINATMQRCFRLMLSDSLLGLSKRACPCEPALAQPCCGELWPRCSFEYALDRALVFGPPRRSESKGNRSEPELEQSIAGSRLVVVVALGLRVGNHA